VRGRGKTNRVQRTEYKIAQSIEREGEGRQTEYRGQSTKQHRV